MTTNENKHTPGPWIYDRQVKGHNYVNVWEKSGIGHVAAVSTGLTPDASAVSNARLIAAAPELLEALLAMMEIIGPPEDPAWADDDQLDAAWKLSVTAVAKASSSH